MTKSETRELSKLTQYRAMGADSGMIARSLSALIRAARTARSVDAIRAVAQNWGVTNHPEFIC